MNETGAPREGIVGGERKQRDDWRRRSCCIDLNNKGGGLRNGYRGRISFDRWEQSENEGQRRFKATLVFFVTSLCAQA